jgi:hypothetical protein
MSLFYRFGFLCHHLEDAPPAVPRWGRIRRSWRKLEIGEFVLRLHPETRIEVHHRPEGAVAVVGDAYGQYDRSLAEIVTQMPWDDPWPALDDLGGRHAILLLSGARMRAAHDPFGSRTLFYAPGRRAVASHVGLLARPYGIEPDPEVAEFMEMPEYKVRTVCYFPGDLTTATGVYGLAPNNYWDGERTHRYWPRAPLTATTRADFYAEADRYFAAFVPFVRSRYTPVFGVTGGIDSRAAFAAFGGDFRGTSWINHLPAAERPIIDRIVAHLGVEHGYLRTKSFGPGPVTRAAGVCNGGVRPGHLLSEAMAATYGPGHCFIRGLGGEVLRGFPAYDNRLRDLSPRSMMIAYSSGKRRCGRSPAYVAYCERAFEGFRARANYDGLEAFGIKPVDLFYWEHRMAMWGANMMNEMDPGCYSLIAFNSRPLYAAAFGLPDDQRLSKELLATYARRHDAAMAEIDYL